LRVHSLLPRRPSPAIVISSIALFMSLGGVGYAAISLPYGSVGTDQLQNGSVTYKKIVPGSVGVVRANTNQLQVRVNGTCGAGAAVAAIDSSGKVTCNPALPAEFGTTNNSAPVPTTSTTATPITSVALPTGFSYLAFANPTVTVTGTGTLQRVTVTCTLTVGSNTETRNATLDTGVSTTPVSTSIPMQVAGGSGTASVACTSESSATPAAAVSVTSAVNALQTSGNS
jgi:hypothetical protein